MKEQLNARFTGHVQGVGFRATCRQLANRHGLTGWVRNEPDSSVRLEAQGKEKDLNDFFNDLRDTHAGAGIRGEDLKWGDSENTEPGFYIRM